MARTPFVAANWKMHKSISESIAFVDAFRPKVKELENVELLLCPPYTALAPLKDRVQGSRIMLGAQNLHWAAEGAYTGEISGVMLRELCQFVIVGHSERRAYFGETNETVNQKLSAAFHHGLRPILCVGESLEQREAGETGSFVSNQVSTALEGCSSAQLEVLVIAYEPIWAIGTGKATTPADAAEVINGPIRQTVDQIFGSAQAGAMRVLYGGSVNPANAKSFFVLDGIDGALVGGASLDAESFSAIASAAG